MGIISAYYKSDATHTLSEDYSRTYTQTIVVVTTGKDVGPVTIRTYLYDLLGQTWANGFGTDTDHAAVLLSLDLKCVSEDGTTWEAGCTWGPYDPLTHAPSPLDLPPWPSWEGINYEEIADLDINGAPIINTAYDYFDPPVTMDQMRGTLTVTVNVASLSPGDSGTAYTTILQYCNNVNLNTWNGFPPKSLKISPPSIERKYHQNVLTNGGNYYSVTWKFEYTPRTWQKSILNQGYRQVVDGNRRNILVDGAPASSPVPLDESGEALLPPVDASNIVVLNFDVYPTVDFNALFPDWPPLFF